MSDTATNGNGRGTLRLSEARERTPPVDPVKACQQSLQLALFGAIGEGDIMSVVGKLKAMALAGDLKAMQMLFALTMGGGPAKPPPAPQQIVVVNRGGRKARRPRPLAPAADEAPADFAGADLPYQIVGRNAEGGKNVIESHGKQKAAVAQARLLAEGGIDYAELTVEQQGRDPVARFTPAREG